MKRRETDAIYDQLPLTDALAAQRTILSAERTLLSYARSAFALVVGGVTGSVALAHPAWQLLSYAFITGGVALVVLGLWRYRVESARLARLVRNAAARRGGGA